MLGEQTGWSVNLLFEYVSDGFSHETDHFCITRTSDKRLCLFGELLQLILSISRSHEKFTITVQKYNMIRILSNSMKPRISFIRTNKLKILRTVLTHIYHFSMCTLYFSNIA